MKAALFLLTAWLATAAVLAQTPVRDQARVTFVGSAVINGTVVADDDTRAPLRNALVTLSRTNIEDMRAVTTDEQGRFRFDALPAGRYALSASKGAYVSMGHGARKPGGLGEAIALTEGQLFEAKPIVLMRGAVIAGRLLGRNGQPVAGVRVQASQFVVVNGARRRRESSSTSGESRTNAHGDYRVFGLVPGEYLVSAADSSLSAQYEVAPAELAWARQSNGPAPPPARPFSLAPSMYPGTADPAAAVPIALERAEERLGVDFALQYVPVSRISGIVTDSDGRPAAGLRVSLTPSSIAGWWTAQIQAMNSGADGAFSFSGLAPGLYRISTQGGRVTTQVSATVSRVNYTTFAMAELNLNGQDRNDIALRLEPGMTVTGQLVFNGAAATPPPDPTRVQLRLANTIMSSVPGVVETSAVVTADGTFKFDGVLPGPQRLTVTMPSPVGVAPVWTARSAMAGGTDALDVPLVVAPGQSVAGLVLTFVDARTEIAGRLMDPSGSGQQLYVLVFSSDKSNWTPGSRRVASVLTSEAGAYAVSGLPPGDYYLCALTDFDADLKFDTSYLEQLVPSAIKLTLAEGEKKRQDLQVGRREGGAGSEDAALPRSPGR